MTVIMFRLLLSGDSQFIHPLSLFRSHGEEGVGGYPSCRVGRGGVHPGQVASLSQG